MLVVPCPSVPSFVVRFSLLTLFSRGDPAAPLALGALEPGSEPRWPEGTVPRGTQRWSPAQRWLDRVPDGRQDTKPPSGGARGAGSSTLRGSGAANQHLIHPETENTARDGGCAAPRSQPMVTMLQNQIDCLVFRRGTLEAAASRAPKSTKQCGF